MIEAILPAGVAAVDTFDDPPDAVLLPEEELIIASSVEKRRLEFTTARYCARAALARLGMPPVPILAGRLREPLWPAGVVGAITHCAGYRGVVVARETTLATIGIDAEPNEAMINGVLDTVASPDERIHVAELLKARPEIRWDRMLFCAKEAVYKSWYPLTQRWLDFEDAAVTMLPGSAGAMTGEFQARLLVTGPRLGGKRLDGFTGRWLVDNGLILTAIAVPATVAVRPSPPRALVGA
ncbi:4'-phosphopantetheinyl transferase family protein [Paractinoplanes lichenicola]|uniref:4'-phosphopantetheinyl transferase superfamily protein n=1 Tax=Paractinoplanes lichenicola TaxID=2802976 RepID=A0ABS1W0P3_9ACTN|nr:4'-phosphopantetheinyl transferase superfamily protein [Actinoplanes lichenicola]MBL7260312.1 4'-phosphopantetheinyl transferase superfamily protein [Actinoplanes lichenicola]